MTQSCRTCVFLDVKPGERRIAYRMYPCTAPMPEKPILPSSVSYHLRGSIDQAWNKERQYKCSGPDDGKDCPTYSKIKKAKA